MSSSLHFADLGLLWVLAPAYGTWIAFWLVLPKLRQRFVGGGAVAIRFSSLKRFARIRTSPTVRLRSVIRSLRWLSVALLLVALLRPQTGRSLTQVNTEGIDIVLVIDTSGSMEARDLDAQERVISRRRNRLEVSQAVVERFVEGRENDQIGLVIFGEQAFTQCPLTLDHGIVATFLRRLEIGMAGDATAIGAAVGTAVKRLRDSQAKSKVIVLLTDGQSNAGSITPLTAAEIAKTYGVKIYAIGAGTKGEAPFLVDTRTGPEVRYLKVDLDEDTLRRMAELTGGAYFRAEDASALDEIYSQINELETTKITMESYMEYDEQYRWFVYPAVLLLLTETSLLLTRFRKLP